MPEQIGLAMSPFQLEVEAEEFARGTPVDRMGSARTPRRPHLGHSGRGSELIQQDIPILRGQSVRFG